MTKRINMILYVLSLSLVMTGCGSNTYPTVEPVTAKADVIESQENISEEVVLEETISEEIDSEETKPEVTDEEVEEEVVEDEVEEEPSLEYAIDCEYAVTDLIPKKPLTTVTKAAREEYERRLEEGFVYEPEIIISDYTGYSDAEIIDIVNKRYLELHNEKRAELGVAPLTETNGMHKAATIRAEEISYFWSHTRPDGSLGPDTTIPWDGLYDQEIAENLSEVNGFEGSIEKSWTNAEDFYSDFADRGFDWLCNSPGHYKTLSDPRYGVIGIDSYIVRYKDFILIYTAFEFATY